MMELIYYPSQHVVMSKGLTSAFPAGTLLYRDGGRVTHTFSDDSTWQPLVIPTPVVLSNIVRLDSLPDYDYWDFFEKIPPPARLAYCGGQYFLVEGVECCYNLSAYYLRDLKYNLAYWRKGTALTFITDMSMVPDERLAGLMERLL